MLIAGIQTDVVFKDVNANLSVLESHLRSEVAQGTGLTVFPECFTTGYCFDSLEEAMPYAESVPGPTTVSHYRAVQGTEYLCRLRDARKIRLETVQHGRADRT
jgi:predicted amidohydrolase